MWKSKAKANNAKQTKKIMDRITTDIKEIIVSILSLKLKTSVWLTAVFGSFTIGSVTGFINDWVCTPAESFIALIAIILCDAISGMYRAYKANAFETKKAVRVFWTLLSHSALLMMSFNLAKSSDLFGYVNDGLFTTLCTVNLLSLVKNLSLLGLVPPTLAKWLYNRIDVYKNEMDKKDSGNTDPNNP